ncbi:unnamed protein product, partial [Coregonus sp. 'balchen']
MLSPKNRQTRRGQEMALKAGWLKRQRSIMRNWQLQWFVLQTEALYFYKDQDETKPQGCILLQGSQVSELSANQDEAGRHLFEIAPGGSGEKDRSGLSESFLSSKPLVPLLVQQCVCFIHQNGLTEEGLFRMPGQTNHVRELQDAFNCGEKPLFDSNTDVHTVASLLKLYLRELPEPVVQHLMSVLISEHSRLYQGEAETPREDQSAPPPTPYPRVPPIQRCKVEWLSQEDILPPNSAQDYPSLGQTLNTPNLGPSKQSKSQSSWRSSLKGRFGSAGVRGKLGGSAVDVSTVTGGNWLMNGLTSFRSHRRTASTGERLKESSLCLKETHKDSLLDSYTDSSLSLKDSSHSQRSTLKDSSPLHIDSSCSTIGSSYPNIKPSLSVRNSPHSNRLSTYDNVNVTPCSLSMPGGSPSPWTSCEIPLAESTGSECSTLNSGLGSGLWSGQAVAGSSVAGGSSSALELSVSSAGWTEGDPGDDISGQRSGVNEEEDLGQEKKRFRMMEIRLGNSERARQDAETRNVLLQKEME